MTAAHPLIVTWDDHESTNNSWSGGAQNHQPETEGDWEARKLASAIAYAEWLPIRLPDPTDPLTIWRRYTYGDLVDLFILDTRLQRNAPETDVTLFGAEANDPSRSMLGEAQREWLFQGLEDSQARNIRWRVLAQQTMIAPHRSSPDLSILPLPYLPPEIVESLGLRQGGGNEGSDNWGAYVFERDRLMRHLRDQGIGNNVVLSGDIHTAWACDVVEDPYTPFNPLSASLTGAPGYNPVTGQGAVAVEFTSMSVTSNNFIDMEGGEQIGRLLGTLGVVGNPNVQYWNPACHGWVLIDIQRDRVTGEFWNTGTALQALGPDDDAVLDAAWAVDHRPAGALFANHLRPA
jgi:alkaline phosphatase D